MEAIREYVALRTTPHLTKEAIATLLSNIECMACDRPEEYRPIRSNTENPLRSPALHHLAWNIGERLGVPLAKRAHFIKESFPHELGSTSHEYLRLNLRDHIPSQIPIDVPTRATIASIWRRSDAARRAKRTLSGHGFIELVRSMLNTRNTF